MEDEANRLHQCGSVARCADGVKGGRGRNRPSKARNFVCVKFCVYNPKNVLIRLFLNASVVTGVYLA